MNQNFWHMSTHFVSLIYTSGSQYAPFHALPELSTSFFFVIFFNSSMQQLRNHKGRELSLMCKFTINNSSLVSPKRLPWRTFTVPAFSLRLPLFPSFLYPCLPASLLMKHSNERLSFSVFSEALHHLSPSLGPRWAHWIKYPGVMENESEVVAYALVWCEEQGEVEESLPCSALNL